MSDIETRLGLTQDRLVLYALLAGGDYDGGIQGCGAETARKIALSGVGDDLISQIRDAISWPSVDSMISGWQQKIRTELQSRSLTVGGTRAATLLSKHINSFPPRAPAASYIHPTTSNTQRQFYPHGAGQWKGVTQPNLLRLLRICKGKLFYDDPRQLLKLFEDNVLEGAVLRLIYSVSSSLIQDALIGTYLVQLDSGNMRMAPGG